MRIFFSWSGQPSEDVARFVKPWLMNNIFQEQEIEIFISKEDIELGSEWYSRVRDELVSCDLAVIFLTANNVNTPWLNFEAGAVAVGEQRRPVITFLIDVSVDNIKSPLKNYQPINASYENIKKLILDIKSQGNFNGPADGHIDVILDIEYKNLLKGMAEIKKKYDDVFIEASTKIFPENVTMLKKNKIFIASPMASVGEEAYAKIRKDVLELKRTLEEECGFDNVYYPGQDLEGVNWDGIEDATRYDFEQLKESEHYILIFPERATSSILVEVGYAIALSKNILIFTNGRDLLPYMLKKADKAIKKNVRIYEYVNFSEIVNCVIKDKQSLFTGYLQ